VWNDSKKCAAGQLYLMGSSVSLRVGSEMSADYFLNELITHILMTLFKYLEPPHCNRIVHHQDVLYKHFYATEL
jgi:hypothetical protein